jgi:hypothetical protein
MSAQKVTWAEILGEKGSSLTPEQRLENWTKFFSTHPADMADYWNGSEGCEGCAHLCVNVRNGFKAPWCVLQELPASFNPILTTRMSMVGMACMGAGKEPVDANGQAALDLSEGDLPF